MYATDLKINMRTGIVMKMVTIVKNLIVDIDICMILDIIIGTVVNIMTTFLLDTAIYIFLNVFTELGCLNGCRCDRDYDCGYNRRV